MFSSNEAASEAVFLCLRFVNERDSRQQPGKGQKWGGF